MTIAFPDLSGFQGGLRIQPATVAVIAKGTEGTYYRDAWYQNFKNQATAAGAVFSAYHFLKQEGSAALQAHYCYDFSGNTPVMLDVETENSSRPGMLEIMSFINTMKNLGGRVWGVYLPKWYWEEIGSPDLTPITDAGAVVVSSAYDYVGGDNGPGWERYGNANPRVWQFTDRLSYGGMQVDFNAYKGTVAEFAALVHGAVVTPPAPVPVPGPFPTVSLAIVQMAERSDPSGPQGATTNYNNVIWVERALQAEGLLESRYVDGSFGTLTVQAYAAYQRRIGYSGADADGGVGMASLSKLGAAHGFRVIA